MVHRWRTSLMAIGPDRYEVTWCVDHGEVQSTVIFVGNPVLAGYR
jgi:hypothetical protein